MDFNVLSTAQGYDRTVLLPENKGGRRRLGYISFVEARGRWQRQFKKYNKKRKKRKKEEKKKERRGRKK